MDRNMPGGKEKAMRGRGRGRRLSAGRGRIRKERGRSKNRSKKEQLDGELKFEALEYESFKEEFWQRVYESNGQKYPGSDDGAGLAGVHLEVLGEESGTESFCDLLENACCHKESDENNGVQGLKVVIICSSAERCLRFLKIVSSRTSLRCTKLFARHIKIQEQIKDLEKRVDVGIGTPNRLDKLMRLGALPISGLKTLIVDSTKDVKGMDILKLQV